MAEPPSTSLFENKKQCSYEPSTNSQTISKTVDGHPVLPCQTSADETKEKRSIELVPFLLLDSYTEINPTQSIPTLITQRYPIASRRNQSVNWDNLVKIHVGTSNSSYITNLNRGKPTPKLPGF